MFLFVCLFVFVFLFFVLFCFVFVCLFFFSFLTLVHISRKVTTAHVLTLPCITQGGEKFRKYLHNVTVNQGWAVKLYESNSQERQNRTENLCMTHFRFFSRYEMFITFSLIVQKLYQSKIINVKISFL